MDESSTVEAQIWMLESQRYSKLEYFDILAFWFWMASEYPLDSLMFTDPPDPIVHLIFQKATQKLWTDTNWSTNP